MVYRPFSVRDVFTKQIFFFTRIHFNVSHVIYFSLNFKNQTEIPLDKIQSKDIYFIKNIKLFKIKCINYIL